jgi:hypothetical protein
MGVPRSELNTHISRFGIPLTSVRQATGEGLGIAESAGDHNLDIGTNIHIIIGEVSNNETETSESFFQFTMPHNFATDGTVQIEVRHRVFGAGTNGASTIDMEVFRQEEKAIGSDLVTTAAITTIDDTWTTSQFDVTSTTLDTGDLINVVMTSVVVESAAAALTAEIDNLAVLVEVHG